METFGRWPGNVRFGSAADLSVSPENGLLCGVEGTLAGQVSAAFSAGPGLKTTADFGEKSVDIIPKNVYIPFLALKK